MLKNASLSSHMKHLHGNPARIACTTCPKTFSTAGYFRQHLATIHSLVERPRYPCTFPGCTKSYLDHGHIAKHIKMEHVQNPARFPCTLCGKEFKAKKDLGRHIGKHTKEKSHVCGTCGRGFREMSDLRGHEVRSIFNSGIYKFEIKNLSTRFHFMQCFWCKLSLALNLSQNDYLILSYYSPFSV